jgi:hypothetical protein
MVAVRMTDHLITTRWPSPVRLPRGVQTDAKDACVICYYRIGEELAWPLYVVNRDRYLGVARPSILRQAKRGLLRC